MTSATTSRIAAALAAVAGVATMGAYLRALPVVAFPRQGDPNRVASGAAPARAERGDFVRRAQEALAWAPLDQRKFNAWYVHEANARAPSGEQARNRAQLARLGWRDTAAQLNLVYGYALAGTPIQSLPRIDALLRRNVAVLPILSILWTLEQTGQVRGPIADLLTAGPVWRSTFMRAVPGLATEQAITARAMTIADLTQRGVVVSRGEVAPVIRRLVAIDRIAQAYVLWRATLERRTDGGSFDPTFAVAAGTAASGTASDDIPFEWVANRGPEFTVAFEPMNAAAGGVRIRWSGMGVPVFLRQTMRLMPGRYVLRVTGSDAGPALLSRLRFSLRCPGRTIGFVMPEGVSPGTLELVGDRVVDCAYPRLVVGANVEDSIGRFDVSLSSIELRRR